MIYNVITFADGKKEKLVSTYTEAEIRKMCEIQGREVVKIERLGLVDKTTDPDTKLYYKVIWGFDEERTTDIDETELVKALYAMSTKSKVYLGDILLDGKYIIAIKENYQKYMNWNATHAMTSDDWNEIRDKGIDKLFAGKVYEAKQKAQEIIANKDTKQLSGNQKS